MGARSRGGGKGGRVTLRRGWGKDGRQRVTGTSRGAPRRRAGPGPRAASA